jgi:two-component system NtrC family sensor kinase
MKLYIKILMLLVVPAIGMAQRPQPDSLKKHLMAAKTDSERYAVTARLGFYYLERNRQLSLNYWNRAILIAKKNDDPIDEAYGLAVRAYLLMEVGKYPESFQYLQEASRLSENPADENKSWNFEHKANMHESRLAVLAQIHHKIGLLMGETSNIEEEIIQFKKAIVLCEESKSIQLLGLSHMTLAQAYLLTNKSDLALTEYKNAERVYNQVKFLGYMGSVYRGLAEIYLKRGQRILALQYAHQAVNAAKAQNNFSGLSSSYEYLTNYYLGLKQPDSSFYYAVRTIRVVRMMGSKDLGNAYENLYKSYRLKNNRDSAYKYQTLALTAQDSTYQSTIKSLADFQKLSFSEKLHSQALEKEKEAIQTRIRIYVLLTAIGMLLLLSIIFYLNYRQKQKANHLLHEQKEEIETQRDNLGHALDELKSTQKQLIQSEKMASLGELTAGIAHEIQNPLNFVNNFSEVNKEMLEELKAESEKPKAERDEQLENDLINDLIENEQKINHHGKRADFIVKGMLQHSRTSTGERELTNINTLADEFLKLSYHGLRAKDKNFNAEMITHFDEALPKVNIAQQDIGRVLLNIFNNAFYAVNQKKKTAGDGYKPEVTVSTAIEKDSLVIKVKDNGNGIPDAIKDKIMQPFFTTKPTGEGTGLGLSLSYDIVVKGHGGAITVDSKEGDFTEFRLILPLIN